MAILNTTVIETVIQNKINNLTTASSVVDIVLPITVSNLDIGLTSSVATSNELPDIATSGLPDGHVVFVRDIGMHVVASQNQWLSLDGRVFKYPTGSSPWPLWSWGANIYGQLGNNSVVNKSSPVSIASIFTDWSQVSAGFRHTAAIRTNGSLWAWGNNSSGQLGNNNNIIVRSSPVSVVGGFVDWCQASAGHRHTAAVRSNGTLWAWGRNTSGQLGDDTSVNKSSPVQVVRKFHISARSNMSVAIVDGVLWSWGGNNFGQLGDNTTVNKGSPGSVAGGFTDWCQVSASGAHNAAIRTNGTLWTWGINGTGQLGDNTIISKRSPVSVIGGFTDWCQVSASGQHTVALRANGTLWTWGYNTLGGLGDNTTVNKSSPVQIVGGFTDWCQVSAGSNHNVGLRANGSLWTWGLNALGQLGDNTGTNKSSPVSVVGGFTDWCRVSAGGSHTAAVRTNGSLWTWGSNSNGQLGDNTIISKRSPVSVIGGFTDWCQVSAGDNHTAALRTNGTLWTWGYNRFGRLGDNTCINKSSPVSVVGGFTDWCQISAGQGHTNAVRSNGSLWAWGYNVISQLGDNTTISRSSPVSVVGGFTACWSQVSAGSENTAAIRPNGTLLTWGSAGFGSLGDNTAVNKSLPVQVAGGFADWCAVSIGITNSMAAIRTNGTVWTWGLNNYGQLGDNTTVNRSSPVSVVGGITNWCQIASFTNTAAIRTNGTLWTWGRNNLGQLGDNTIVNKSSPVQVVGGFTDWCQVAVNGIRAAAVRTNGTIWSWGLNSSGQLGDNTTVNKSSPISVVSEFTDWCQVSAGYDHTAAIRINT